MHSFEFHPLGFHGDEFLLETMHYCLDNAKYFVETGTNVGSTLNFVARTYPSIKCFSCEPAKKAFDLAVENNAEVDNTKILNLDSVSFLSTLQSHIPARGKEIVCWLDAHGQGFEWPLREEVHFFTRKYSDSLIFIDDFKVENNLAFGFDRYNNQECSLEFIQDMIAPGFSIGYPTYEKHTSGFHPLRGWCLLMQQPDSRIPNCQFRKLN